MYDKVNEVYGAYKVKDIVSLKELNGTGYILEHEKTKAKVVLVSNDDENKVFTIGFRTPPKNNTGVPHIMEHSVLCGSKKFPLKDPFVELVKGSLNTFLNAMTYSDKTVYPIASCNDKDFHNLMHVYLDAVFYPNIYKKKEIMMQEGWHYELSDKEDKITLNGVVYNEMKGVFSSPEQRLMRMIQKSLLKDTTYGYESGGEPEHIPELTYEEFLEFHKKYYHPSNSYIYLYGNIDMEKELDFIDKEYLSKFDYLKVDSEIETQPAFKEMQEVEEFYPIAKEDEEDHQTYFSYNAVVGNSLDRKLYLAFQILEYVLLNVPGAPVKKALIEAGIGNDVFSSYDNGIKQPTFSIVVQGAQYEQKEQFLNIVRTTLENIVKNGINKKSLKAAINVFEFQYKEANFGRHPKGLIYGLKMFDSWLYDETKPFIHIITEDTFEYLKTQIETGYFEKLIEEYLLDNPHMSMAVLRPKKNMAEEIEQETAKKLAEYENSLSEEEKNDIYEQTKELKAYQEAEESQDDLKKIPMLSLDDIKKETKQLLNKEQNISGIPVVSHDIFTNGISYIEFAFKIKSIPYEYVPYASLISSLLQQMDTKNYSYGELADEINLQTGGIASTVGVLKCADKQDFIPLFKIKVKTLYGKEEKGIELLREILFNTKFDDKKRLKEIIAEQYAGMKLGLVSSGHYTVSDRAMSYFDEGAAYKEQVDGISFYEILKKWQENFEECSDEIVKMCKETMRYILTENNLIINYTGQQNIEDVLKKPLEDLQESLYEDAEQVEQKIVCEKKNEGIKTSSQVQYVGLAGKYDAEKYTGSLKVLQKIFSYDYLWQNVRVKGGAYGCSCKFSRDMGVFASYRDPGLAKTYEIYKEAVSYVQNFTVSERDMLKYIIGTISDLDAPLTPSGYGNLCFVSYITGYTQDMYQKERDEILSTSQEQIRMLAPVVESVVNSENYCTIGSETKIDQENEYFKSIITLA